jgi:hypothetical protein
MQLQRAGKLKGLARAVRGARVVVRRGEALSREAEEALFAEPGVLSEGAANAGADGSQTYFGSTMLTVDLERLAAVWRGSLDDAGRAQLLRLVSGSVRVHLRAMRLARAEALQRVPGRAVGRVTVEVRASIRGPSLCIDVDLEAPLALSSARRSER